MRIEQTIKRILREEQNKMVDLSPLLKKILNREIVQENSDILCGVEVVHPDNRENYKVTFTFIVHRGKVSFYTKEKHESIMNEAWDIIYDYTGQPVDLYSKYVRTCNE